MTAAWRAANSRASVVLPDAALPQMKCRVAITKSRPWLTFGQLAPVLYQRDRCFFISSSRDGQPRHVEVFHAGGVAAGDPRIVVRGRLGLFVVRHPGQDLGQDLPRLRKRRLAVRIVRAGIVNLSKQGWYPPAVGGAAVRCREVLGTAIGLPPLKREGPRRSTRPS